MSFKYKLSVCVSVKNEAKYMPEFIEHYVNQGVDHFYIVNNNSSDNIEEMFQSCKHKDMITFITDNRDINIYIDVSSTEHQKAIWNDNIYPLIVKETEWAIIIDADEFMYGKNGHTIKTYDLSFLPQKEGYFDESVDFIFLRHALEHSPYPIFSLMEYNRVLKQGGKLYIEVPAPDTQRKHEWNLNHYSILGEQQLAALLDRTGFAVNKFDNFEFELSSPNSEDPDKPLAMKEKYYCVVATKARPLDIK